MRFSIDAVPLSELRLRMKRLCSMLDGLDMRLTELKRCWNATLLGTHIKIQTLENVQSVRYVLSSEACVETMKECLDRMETYRMSQVLVLQEQVEKIENP